MSIFKELDKTIQESKLRWNKIEELTSQIKGNPTVESTAALLILLVEHLRPLHSSADGDESPFDLGAIINAFTKGGK
jgi:hypothetical protein